MAHPHHHGYPQEDGYRYRRGWEDREIGRTGAMVSAEKHVEVEAQEKAWVGKPRITKPARAASTTAPPLFHNQCVQRCP